MNNIYLLGFMGSGKSNVGRRLAAITGLAFKDTDAEIKKAAGAGVADIITGRGLKAFRRLEDSVLRQISRGCRQVVAAGGGVTLTKKRGFLARTGVTVYLACSEKALLKRLAEAPDPRPLLGKDREKRPAVISRLLKRRRPCYERADITLDVSGLSQAQTAARIETAVKKHDKNFFLPGKPRHKDSENRPGDLRL